MDAPPIHYCRTEDGVNIAYWTLGEGPVLVILQPVGPSHLEVEWRVPEIAGTFERLATRCRVVRFDFRNCGMSDRGIEACGFDEQYMDLLAVVAALDLTRVVIQAEFGATKHAVRFAAEHPETTAGLVLSTPDFGPARRPGRSPGALHVLAPLIDTDWDAYADAVAAVVFGLDEPRTAQFVSQRLRAGISPQDYRRMAAAVDRADIEPWFAGVRAPVRVIHLDAPIYDMATTRACAAALPASQLTVLQGIRHPWQKPFQEVVLTFLDELDERDRIISAPAADPGVTGTRDPAPSPLTPREFDVLRQIALGRTNAEIATALYVETSTISRHVHHILRKTKAHNRAEAVTWAFAHRLLQD